MLTFASLRTSDSLRFKLYKPGLILSIIYITPCEHFRAFIKILRVCCAWKFFSRWCKDIKRSARTRLVSGDGKVLNKQQALNRIDKFSFSLNPIIDDK